MQINKIKKRNSKNLINNIFLLIFNYLIFSSIFSSCYVYEDENIHNDFSINEDINGNWEFSFKSGFYKKFLYSLSIDSLRMKDSLANIRNYRIITFNDIPYVEIFTNKTSNIYWNGIPFERGREYPEYTLTIQMNSFNKLFVIQTKVNRSSRIDSTLYNVVRYN